MCCGNTDCPKRRARGVVVTDHGRQGGRLRHKGECGVEVGSQEIPRGGISL